jgi:hypothetical protein
MRRAGRLVSPAFISTEGYSGRFPAKWHVVFRPAPLHWSRPRQFGFEEIEFDLAAAAPELGVLELENGCVFGTHGWAIGAISWSRVTSSRPRSTS